MKKIHKKNRTSVIHFAWLMRTILMGFTLFFAGSNLAFAGEDDWNSYSVKSSERFGADDYWVKFVPDNTNVDNCEIWFVFKMYQESDNPKGYATGGWGFSPANDDAHLYMYNVYIYNQFYKFAYFRNGYSNFEKVSGGPYLYSIPEPSYGEFNILEKQGDMTKIIYLASYEHNYTTVGGYKSLHYRMNMNLLNHEYRWNIEGEWGMVSGSGSRLRTSDKLQEHLYFQTPYTYTLGDLTFSNVSTIASPTGKVSYTITQGAGNTNKYATTKVTCSQNGASGQNTHSFTHVGGSVNSSWDFGDGIAHRYCKQLKATSDFSMNNGRYSSSVNKVSNIVTILGCPYPSNVVSTFDVANKTSTIRWTSNCIDAATTRTDGYWRIIRYCTTDKTHKVVGRTANISTLSFTDTDTDLKYDKEYYYQVSYMHANWENNIEAGVEGINAEGAAFSTVRNAGLSLSYVSYNDKIVLSWKTASYPKTFWKNFAIYRDGEPYNNQTVTPAKDNQTDYLWIDDEATLTACQPHDYEIKAYHSDGTEIGNATLNNIAVGGGMRFNTFKSTKGELTKSVTLTWDMIKAQDDNTVNTYKIKRREAGGSNEYLLINTFQSAEKYLSYTDNSVLPGTFYEYQVECITTCSDGTEVSSTAENVSFAMMRGAVTGQIKYGSGTAVQNVEVYLKKNSTGSGDSVQYYSRYFNGADCYASIDILDDWKDYFSLGNYMAQVWLNPSSASANQMNVMTMPNGLRLNLVNPTDTTYTLQIVCDNRCHAATSATTSLTIPTSNYTNVLLAYSYDASAKCGTAKVGIVKDGKSIVWATETLTDIPVRQFTNGHIYQMYGSNDDADKIAYSEMSESCAAMGGHLATLTSKEENEYVYSLFSAITNYTQDAYIGLSDNISEGIYEWCTGEAYSYKNWGVAQHENNNDLDYAVMELRNENGKRGTWNDVSSGMYGWYICEYEDPVTLGCYLTKQGFNGFLDEFRLWKTIPTDTKILQDYNRVLSGSEADLAAYCTFDEALDKHFFDYSRKGNVYNGHHGQYHYGSTASQTVPDVQLRAFTDAAGSYIINGIPFGGEGTSYSVIPVMGVHEFEPVKTLRYVNENALVHNGIDFTDVSSFTVRGKVTYRYGDFPVEGASVCVDGVAQMQDNELVKTNSDGEYTVSVPIGKHYISIEMNGHTFENGGRYPITGEAVFMDEMRGVNFVDTTLVRIAGRVSGGSMQRDLPLGFGQYGKAKALVGSATVMLTTSRTNARINTGTAEVIIDNRNDTINSTAKLLTYDVQGKNLIEIHTDAATGEFLALLPPLNYDLVSVNTASVTNDNFAFSTEQILPDATVTETDSLGDMTFTYHNCLLATYTADPVLQVSDKQNDEGLFGEYMIKVNERDIPLIRNKSYVLDYPVYRMGEPYAFDLYGYEEYVNKDDSSNPETTHVPLAGSPLSFTANNWAMETTQPENYPTYQSVVTLDTLGKATYRFHGAMPKISDDYLLSMQIAYSVNGRIYTWPDEPKKAYLLGSRMVPGSNFVTDGPTIIDYVLRDPPGSNSYAYLEKGSTITTTTEVTSSRSDGNQEHFEFYAGVSLVISKGLHFGCVSLASENEIKTLLGYEMDREYAKSTTNTNTSSVATTINTRLQTSDSEDYVGAMADIYMGHSTNVLIGASNKLGFFTDSPGANDDALIKTVYDTNGEAVNFYNAYSLAASQEYGTDFFYTGNHISGYLIPLLETTRNSLIQPLGTSSASYFANHPNDTNVYISKVKIGHEDFGREYDWIINPSIISTAATADEVQAYNSSIDNWYKILAYNEQSKVEAKSKVKNISFDAGSPIEESFSLEKTIGGRLDTIKSTSYVHVGGFTGEFHFAGAIETHITAGTNWSEENGSSISDETTQATTVGYVFADGDQGDYYSVDIFKNKSTSSGVITAGSNIFKLVAGQSSCPYEGPYTTQYYEPGRYTIDNGTWQIEKPEMTITNQILTDVRGGKEGSILLKLHNASEANLPCSYVLWMDESTNPDGLVLSIDGQVLTSSGREFSLDAGETITKTLKVRQSRNDIMDYDSIVLHFTSACQNDPYSDMGWIHSDGFFSVHFVPSSSDISIAADNMIINSYTGDVINLTLNDYDLTYDGLKYLRIQRKLVNDNKWLTVKTFAVDDSVAAAERLDAVNGRSTITYAYDMGGISDQTVYFRAQTLRKYGNDDITVESDEIEVRKDMAAPLLLGNASPVNGILTAGGEVSLTFNEKIFASNLTKANFTVKGELNDNVTSHSTALSFANTPVSTEASIALNNTSFSIEMWVKRSDVTANCTLLKHGTSTGALSIGFEGSYLTVSMDGKTYKSEIADSYDDWQYLCVTYNSEAKKLYAHALYGAVTSTLMDGVAVSGYSGSGRIYLGDNFTGTIHKLSIWNKYREIPDLNDMNKEKRGNEVGLIGYWPMNEYNGTIAKDKSRNRHIYLTSESMWYGAQPNYALEINSAKLPDIKSWTQYADENEDFCMELWFNALPANGDSVVIIDLGCNVNNLSAYALILNRGQLTLRSKGTDYILYEKDLRDGIWHHAALNLQRNGSVSTYLDGVTVKQLPASAMGEIITDKIHIGHGYTNGTDDTSTSLKGSVDELRFWKAYLTKEFIKLNMYSRLQGNEAGLMGYYPFDESTMDGSLTVTPDASSEPNAGIEINSADIKSYAPLMKKERQMTDVNFTFAASDYKVVINIEDNINKIENCNLMFEAKYVQDLCGNTIKAVNWSAYVDMNRLKWGDESIVLTQEMLSPETFTTTISNQSNSEEVWVIENLPSWLSVNKSQGTLKQLSQEQLTFTASESTPIGTYEAVVYLTGNSNVQEPLYVTLTVTGERPDWSVEAGEYESSMNLVARLNIEGYLSEDANDLVAAFINDTCVGVANPLYISKYDGYFMMMDIYGNGANEGDEVIFKVWDASTGRVYPTVSVNDNAGIHANILFSNGELKGTPAAPYSLNAEDILEQSIALKKGWNWITLNVDRNFGGATEQMYPDLVFKNVEKNVIQIKGRDSRLSTGQDKNVDCNNGVWNTETPLYLEELQPSLMYQTKMDADAKLLVVGSMVDPATTSIHVNTGWNWIGYTLQDPTNIENAFADLSPAEGDIVKGQTMFAYYTDNAWVGSLKYLQPGHGYMYKSVTAAKDFTYPTVYGGSNGIRSFARTDSLDNRSGYWSCNYCLYPNNMTIIARVVDGEGNTLMNGDVALFNEGTCRGTSIINKHGNVYLTACGDESVELTFKVYDLEKDEVYDVLQTITYRNNAMYGTSTEPYIIKIDPTAINGTSAGITVTPTIVADVLTVNSSDVIRKVTISSPSGVIQSIDCDGSRELSIFAGDLAKGIYLVTVATDNETVTRRIIKQ